MNKLILSVIAAIIMCCVLLSCGSENLPAETDIVTAPVAEPAAIPGQDIRIVSINVAYDIQNMKKRGDLMVPLLLSYSPDSIGTQECGGYTDWVDIFREGLSGYERVGRVSNGALETSDHYSGNYIYYNAEKFECVDWQTIWVTTSPYGISSYKDAIFRTCTWAVLRDKSTGFKYVHINTHLAFENDEINEFQTTMIRDLAMRFEKLGVPVFITGDFNSSEGSTSYNIMTRRKVISDSKYLAEKTMSAGTFRGWDDRDLSGGSPIDFCFVTGERMDVQEYSVIDTFVDGIALSDHQGIFVHAACHDQTDSDTQAKSVSTDGVTVSEVSRRSYVYEFSFTQASDIELIHKYIAELVDNNGEVIATRTILSRQLDSDPPGVLYCTFFALVPGKKYNVRIYAVALDGTYSDPFTFEFVSKELE
ncbi:MAG: hypothetical protein E7627_06920 [Ruminococcaceae bacterium]|nr:hypothetical protein [Oscillospiraceae bacterium]